MTIPLPPQYNTGPLIGSLLFIYGRGIGLVGIVVTLMSAGTWYVVSTGRWPELAVIPLWGFLLILAGIFALLMIFAYMIVAPSSIAFGNLQTYKHENPIKEQLDRIEQRQDRQFKLLCKEIEKLKGNK